MNISEAVISVLSKYASFSGRAMRSEFWLWLLAYVILISVASIIDRFLISSLLGFGVYDQSAGQPLSTILSLGLLVPNLAVSVRRLHDIDRSGWWILIVLVPFIGVFVLIYWCIKPSSEGPNRFGEPAALNQQANFN